MNIHIHHQWSVPVAEITGEGLLLAGVDDALDIIANCGYQGAEYILLHEVNIHPDFFELRTKLAGDVLQKVSTYRIHLAIIGDFSQITGKSLQEFIRESNRAKRVCFVKSAEEAANVWGV